MNGIRAVVIILAMLGWGLLDTALALQCDGKVVSEGDPKWRVREIYGEPADIQDTQQLIPQGYYDPCQPVYVHTFVYINKT
jgi:hypothetical protein